MSANFVPPPPHIHMHTPLHTERERGRTRICVTSFFIWQLLASCNWAVGEINFVHTSYYCAICIQVAIVASCNYYTHTHTPHMSLCVCVCGMWMLPMIAARCCPVTFQFFIFYQSTTLPPSPGPCCALFPQTTLATTSTLAAPTAASWKLLQFYRSFHSLWQRA